MSERFSEELRRKLDAVWEAQHRHPFVRSLAEGTLDEARFQVWIRQDFLFRIEFSRLVALSAARSPDVETIKWMIDRSHGVLHNEMLLHQAYAIEFGLTHEELEAGEKLPTTRAYTDHLFRIAGMGSYLELIAALLPCIWGHAEIGQRLAQGPTRPDARYSRWIEMNSGPVIAKTARQTKDLLDRLAKDAGPRERSLAEIAFAVSSRHEWMFWQMCWQGESWPDHGST